MKEMSKNEEINEEITVKDVIKILVADFNKDLESMPSELRLFVENECANYLRLKGSDDSYFFSEKNFLELLQFDLSKPILSNTLDDIFKNIFGYSDTGDQIDRCQKQFISDICLFIRKYCKNKNFNKMPGFICSNFSYYMDKKWYENKTNDSMIDDCDCSEYLSLSPEGLFEEAAYTESYYLAEDVYLYIKLKDEDNNSEIYLFFNINIDDFYYCRKASEKLIHFARI